LTSRGLATTFEIPIELAEYTGTYVAVVKKDTVQLAVTAQNGKTLSVYTAPSKRSIPLARPAPTNSSASGGGGRAWSFDLDGEGTRPVKAIVQGAGPNRRVYVRQ